MSAGREWEWLDAGRPVKYPEWSKKQRSGLSGKLLQGADQETAWLTDLEPLQPASTGQTKYACRDLVSR